ncbi:MAG: polyprenyl synthetase family protein [Paludibacteraceae bacterium]|nr:polyprenyl synthetase family protein [Paludibacteraceae bacterium]
MDINKEILNLDWKREPYGLYEPIEYTLAAGGKRVRPQLAMIASQLFGGKDEEVLPAALALEVFHNFTLLHDDVMDKADVRRGRPTVHVKWNENTAILSGDQMLIEAYKLLSGVPADKLPKVLQLFNKMATEICEGQQYDVDFESQEQVAIEEYLKMIRLKTSVLLANALQTGAYIAGADERAQEVLYKFGIHIGLAFQIQDDILDVWGDPKTFGKAVGGDISCNKKTFVYLEAVRRLGDEAMRRKIKGDEARPATEAKSLEKWYSQVLEDNTEKITAVKEIFELLDVRSACEKVVEDYTRKALALLEQLPQNEATEQLRQLANKLNTRKD